MGLKRFKKAKRLAGAICLYKSSVSVLLIAGALGGCSSDFSRFTDGITKPAAPAQGGNAVGGYPPAPQKSGYGKVESAALAPPADSAPADSVPLDTVNHDNDETAAPPPEKKAASAQPAYRKPAETGSAAATGSAAKSAHKTVYIVEAGDSLSRIARKHQVSIAAIKRDNDLQSDTIRIGQKLTITGGVAVAETEHKTAAPAAKTAAAAEVIAAPAAEPPATAEETAPPAENSAEPAAQAKSAVTETKTVTADSEKDSAAKTSETASEPAPQSNAASDSAPAAAETAPAAAVKAEEKKPLPPGVMIWPVNGAIISVYGQRTGTSTNDGIDIAVPEGTKVKAAESGTVIYSGDGLKEFGNTILIRHDDNIVTVYGHNSKLLVQRGQQVQRGDDIALSGSSGNASVAKLHFEVRKNSAPVNPVKYLPASQ